MVNLNLYITCNKFEYEANIPVSEEDAKILMVLIWAIS